MTWKNALAGIPHGGGKSGILADPGTPNKETLIRQFARAIENMVGYIPGPDMGTDEVSMAWVRDEIGRSVGLSKVLGGIPLDQIGATGYGLAVCAEVSQRYAGIKLQGSRVVVQGFGNVGSHAARYLRDRGAILVGASDLDGTVYDPKGIDVEKLIAIKRETGRVTDYEGGEKLPIDAWISDSLRGDGAGRPPRRDQRNQRPADAGQNRAPGRQHPGDRPRRTHPARPRRACRCPTSWPTPAA